MQSISSHSHNSNFLNILLLATFLMLPTFIFSQTLEQQVLDKIIILNALIADAENEGIDANKEKMTVSTAETFLFYANWDENNIDINTDFFERVPIYADSAEQMAINLPDFERSECLVMLNEAISQLNKLRAGLAFREPIPVIDWAAITHDGDQLTYNNRPVFLNDYTWKPGIGELDIYHGTQDGFYLSPTHVIDENGTLNTNILNNLNSKPTGTYGFIFLNNGAVPDWTTTAYGDDFKIRENTFNFTKFDIDHPKAIELIGFMLDAAVPLMANKNYIKLGYMLCNEPHWFTKQGVWATGEVSDYTIDKFKIWLETKHGSIANLNALWNTAFNSFDEVTIEIPINGNLQGTPMWYDWCFFNMHRVTQWYQLVKDRIHQSDPDAKTHLKIMPRLWSDNAKDHGIDFEALTRMTEIIGNDAGAWNNHMWGPTEWWEANYAFDWREMSMGYDFQKSVSPEKIAFNSESHYLSKNKSRNLYQAPNYARATYWLAHTLGETATQTWYWARRPDGSPRPNSGMGYAGSNNQQPRIVNEVASTLIDLNIYSEEIYAMQRQIKPLRIFHSKTSAINKGTHMNEEFELYKALFFEGISLGFATKDIINLQDNNNWKAILIHKTEYVTQEELNALQTYLDNGGTIIMDEVSLQMDEYGNAMTALNPSNGTLTIVNSMAEIKSTGLTLLANENLLSEVTVTETNAQNTKGVNWRYIKNQDGNNVLSLVNVGKSEATIQLELQNAAIGTNVKNLLSGVHISSTQILKPNDMLFVEISDESPMVNVKDLKNDLAKIYPNPSTGAFQIEFSEFQQEVELRVFDTTGKLILEKMYQNVEQINNNISNQPTGSYIIQLKNKDGISNHVFVKE